MRSAPILFDVTFDFQLAGRVLTGHVPNLAEDRPLRPPRAVVPAEAPEDAGVGVWVSPIEGEFVVELHHGVEGLARRGRPFEDLLAPEHSEIVVDGAFSAQLPLR